MSLECNKVICTNIPPSFSLKESMVLLGKFNTLNSIEDFLNEHSWAVSMDDVKTNK